MARGGGLEVAGRSLCDMTQRSGRSVLPLTLNDPRPEMPDHRQRHEIAGRKHREAMQDVLVAEVDQALDQAQCHVQPRHPQ